jgi:hypothetical protein
VPLPEGPPFFQFSTEGAFRRVLERFGFNDVNVRTLRLQWRVAEIDDVFEALSHGGVRTSAVLRGQTPEALAAIKLELRQGVNAYASDGGFVLPMPAVLASAAKPA